jgi:hypothetical protein
LMVHIREHYPIFTNDLSFSQTKPILQFHLHIYKFGLLISGLEHTFSARVHDCGPILLKASSLSIPLL